MSATEFDVISPVDETIVKTVPLADRAEVDARVARARRAFAAWRRVAPGDRARLRTCSSRPRSDPVSRVRTGTR